MTTHPSDETITETALSMPRLLLHIEGFAVLVTAILLYAHFQGSGLVFILCLFLPDIAMIGYLRDTKIGANIYNLMHTYPLAMILIGGGWYFGQTGLIFAGLILAAHIGLDRALGYGLKYATAFKDTHFQRV